MVAYDNVFSWMSLAALALIPFLMLIQPPKTQPVITLREQEFNH